MKLHLFSWVALAALGATFAADQAAAQALGSEFARSSSRARIYNPFEVQNFSRFAVDPFGLPAERSLTPRSIFEAPTAASVGQGRGPGNSGLTIVDPLEIELPAPVIAPTASPTAAPSIEIELPSNSSASVLGGSGGSTRPPFRPRVRSPFRPPPRPPF